jgi:8-oxo-dGTP pyrophosphatase MutT (NUDIX family)
VNRVARQRVAARVARVPRVSAAARWIARRANGRHYVAAIGVVVDDGRVLLVRHTFRRDRWALPGGWVRRREDPAAAVARETLEETGIAVQAVELLACDLHSVDGRPLRYGGLTLAYRCPPRDAADRPPATTSVEISEVRWVPAAEALELVRGFERQVIELGLIGAG